MEAAAMTLRLREPHSSDSVADRSVVAHLQRSSLASGLQPGPGSLPAKAHS